jgi:hypothetical protein
MSPAQTDGLDSFYVLDPSALRIGDIILSTVPTDFISRAIRAVTSSDYSHAAIYAEGASLIEAVGIGVRRVMAGRLAIRDLSSVKVLRLRDDAVYNAPEICQRAGNEAAKHVRDKYHTLGAILSVVPSWSADSRRAFFCSHLVVHSFNVAGLELLPGISVDKAVPGALIGSPLLKDVTRCVLVESKASPHLPHSFVDGDEGDLIDSPHAREIAATRALLKALGTHFVQAGLKEPETIEEAIFGLAVKLRGSDGELVDKAFTTALFESGFLQAISDAFNDFEFSRKVDQYIEQEINLGRMTVGEATRLMRFYEWCQPGMEIEGRELPATATAKAFEATGFETFRILSVVFGGLHQYAIDIDSAISRARPMLQQVIEHGDFPDSR